MSAGKRRFLRDAWRLTLPYWRSDERWSARGLLLVVIALSLGSVYVDVRLNQWNNAFYNALQELDSAEFFHQLLIFCILAGADIVLSVYALYLNQMLQIRWRRWLTRGYVTSWLADRNYYRLQLSAQPTDNPDQRIAEDLNLFTSYTMALALGLLKAVVSLASFLVILWGLSGPAAIPLGSWGSLHIPAYLVWAALIYAGLGTWLTVKIGRPLIRLNFDQQRYEADFRFSLVRLRENAESVALYGGERREGATFHDRFQHVFVNFWQIMRRTKALGWFTYGYNQIAVIFPVVVVAPRFFAREIQLGGLMQVIDAFGSVQTSLSFLINSYTDIARWQAVCERLSGFDERMREAAAAARVPQPIAVSRDGGAGLAVSGLSLALPDGKPLIDRIDLAVEPGQSLLLSGATGTGKSTLLRAIAGIWPFGRGAIRLGSGKVLFLPQQPYIPLGSLREALLYPEGSGPLGAGDAAVKSVLPDARLVEVLNQVGLGSLSGELDTTENWAQRLSLGEQQRLAFARILLSEPAVVFLDEATSALDEPSEARLYRILRNAPWHPTVISVGHRSTLREFHDRVLDVASTATPRRVAQG